MGAKNIISLPKEDTTSDEASGSEYSAKYKCILDLTAENAKEFFLKGESYCNFDLPSYFSFDALLANIENKIAGKSLSDFYSAAKPQDCEGVNYVILNNKNGKFAWRPMQLIHPALYVSLVEIITEETNWKYIQARFSLFSGNNQIRCVSVPLVSMSYQKDKAEQVSNWWHEVEQRSLEFALDYQYLLQTDITDCYGSIYTHSIAWALHDKTFVKKPENKNNKNLLGNIIDRHIRQMCHGQTNGIPQGSTLMDFFSEMVLGYADSALAEKIEKEQIKKYHILRYRDDYRIFTNNPQEGEKILKFLTEVLTDLGLKLSPSKTTITSNVIGGSIKADKLYWLGQKQQDGGFLKHLLIIHTITNLFGTIIAYEQ